MWARVENGVLLYTPIIAVSGDTHTHIYLSGQTPRVPSGEISGKDMRDRSGKPQMSGPRALIEGVFGGRFPRDFGELGGIWGVDRSAGM